jgi:hypothetical protein
MQESIVPTTGTTFSPFLLNIPAIPHIYHISPNFFKNQSICYL